jgi:hypothetical protein
MTLDCGTTLESNSEDAIVTAESDSAMWDQPRVRLREVGESLFEFSGECEALLFSLRSVEMTIASE